MISVSENFLVETEWHCLQNKIFPSKEKVFVSTLPILFDETQLY